MEQLEQQAQQVPEDHLEPLEDQEAQGHLDLQETEVLQVQQECSEVLVPRDQQGQEDPLEQQVPWGLMVP